jgi:hypothetical protein
MRNSYRILENLKRRDNSEDVSADGKIKSLEKYGGSVWSGCV